MFNIVGRFRKAFGIHMNKKAEKLDVRVTFNEGAKTPVRITARTKKLRSTLIDKLEEENPFQFDFGSFYDVSDRDDPT